MRESRKRYRMAAALGLKWVRLRLLGAAVVRYWYLWLGLSALAFLHWLIAWAASTGGTLTVLAAALLCGLGGVALAGIQHRHRGSGGGKPRYDARYDKFSGGSGGDGGGDELEAGDDAESALAAADAERNRRRRQLQARRRQSAGGTIKHAMKQVKVD